MKHLWLTLMLVCIVWLPGLASATMVLYTPLPQMTEKSDLIVHAEVIGQKVVRDEAGRIKTHSSLRVIESVRGATKGETLKLSQVGGELDGEVAHVVGTSRFSVGEQVVIFGARLPNRVVMFAVGVGKYRVFEEGGRTYAMPEIGDVQFVARGSSGGLEPVKYPVPTAKELSVFLANLRDHLKAAGVK